MPPQLTAAVDGNLKPLGDQTITSPSSSTGLTVPAGARYALIQAFTQNVRWTDSGTAPTSSTGFEMQAGSDPFWYTGDLTAIRFIQETTNATIYVSYYTVDGTK